MADITATIEQIKSAALAAGVNAEAFDKWSATLSEAQRRAMSLSEAAANLNTDSNALTAAFNALNNSANNLFNGVSFGGFISKINDTEKSLTQSAVNMGLALVPAFARLPEGTMMYGELGKAGSLAGSSVVESWGAVSKLMGVANTDLAKGIERVAVAADRGRNVQANLMGMYAAAGNLPRMLREIGESADRTTNNFDRLEDISANYAERTFDVAQSVNMSTEQISKYNDMLRKIPDAMDQTVDVQGIATGSMNQLTAALKIASGMGLDHQDAVQQLSWAYDKFGIVGKNAVSMIAYVAQAAQDANMPMEDFRKTVMNLSEQFKMFGDNTEGVTNIVGTFSKAFRESGLGPEGAAELTSTMVSGIKQMDLAHKAFFSAASGGPAGLQGAFEIDYLMMKGETDKVMEKVLSGLENQFGRIVTLQEAQTSPELQAELIKQVSFLTDVAGIAKTPEDAYRILEAMQAGATDELATIMEGAVKDPQQIMTDAINIGNKVQEQMYSELVTQTNVLNKIAGISDLQAARMERGLLGAAEGTTAGARKTMEEAAKAGRGPAMFEAGESLQTRTASAVDELGKSVEAGEERINAVAGNLMRDLTGMGFSLKAISDVFGILKVNAKGAAPTLEGALTSAATPAGPGVIPATVPATPSYLPEIEEAARMSVGGRPEGSLELESLMGMPMEQIQREFGIAPVTAPAAPALPAGGPPPEMSVNLRLDLTDEGKKYFKIVDDMGRAVSTDGERILGVGLGS